MISVLDLAAGVLLLNMEISAGDRAVEDIENVAETSVEDLIDYSFGVFAK